MGEVWMVEQTCKYDGCERDFLEVYAFEDEARARAAEAEAALEQADNDVQAVYVYRATVGGKS